MPISTLSKAEDIMKTIKGQGFEISIPIADLRRIICLICGFSQQTIDSYLEGLTTLGFLTQNEFTVGLWDINFNPNVFKKKENRPIAKGSDKK